MKQAEFIKKMEDWNGDARMYKLGDDYVVISAIVAWGTGEPETFAFQCDANGKVGSWGELSGSIWGSLDHEKVLNNLGYTDA